VEEATVFNGYNLKCRVQLIVNEGFDETVKCDAEK